MSEPITNVEDAVAVLGALPVPQGPEPRTLEQVEHELDGANLSLYEEELLTARLRLALASAQRGRRELRARVAALLAERHVTNEALDDAVQALRERDGHIAEQKAELLTLHTLRGDVALLVERERGHGEECVDIADVVDALGLSDDESGGAR